MAQPAKHTPGPLKAVQIIIENSPCTWAVQRKSTREQWGKPSIATYIDNEADARLFAAAPAMYEALRVLTSEINLSTLNVRKDFSLMNAHACAVKAILQAEGRRRT